MEEAAQRSWIMPIWVSAKRKQINPSKCCHQGCDKCQQVLDWMGWKSVCYKGDVIVAQLKQKVGCSGLHVSFNNIIFLLYIMPNVCCTHYSCLGSLDSKSDWQTHLLSINFRDFTEFPVFAKATILCPLNRLQPVTQLWGKQIIRSESALWIKEEQVCPHWAKNTQ